MILFIEENSGLENETNNDEKLKLERKKLILKFLYLYNKAKNKALHKSIEYFYLLQNNKKYPILDK